MNEDKNEPEIIWHYTKMEVLKKMLEPDGVNLRFSHFKFTKDPSEGLVLRKFLIKNKENILEQLKIEHKIDISEKEFDDGLDYKLENINTGDNDILRKNDIYIFSTTSLKNSMIFWNKEYAGTSGISIGFNLKKIEDGLDHDNEFVEEINYLDVLTTKSLEDNYIKHITKNIKLCYELAIKIHNILNLNIYNLKEEEKDSFFKVYGLMTFLKNHSCMYKHNAWTSEDEIRIEIPSYSKYIKDNKEKKIEIELCENKLIKVYHRKFNKNIINYIMLGPDYTKHHKEAFEKYLEDNSYKDIKVELSYAFDFRQD